MSRGGKIALALALGAVVFVGVVVTVSAGFHGLVIYAFFALFALATVALAGFGGEGIQEWSRSRFKDRPGSR